MDRLNYFNPYESKGSHYEDQLTRAYLTLLRYSYQAFSLFYVYCTKAQATEVPLYDLMDEDWNFSTQKSNPLIETEKLLSILITDSHLSDHYTEIEKSDRNARYDGIITLGSKLTLIIEVKPRNNDVWWGQLRPSKNRLAEDTFIYPSPAILEWKQIIGHLNKLIASKASSGFEKMMIEDFLAFVDERFSYLNPFDNLYLCKNNIELLKRRISNLLKGLVRNEELVQTHRGWGHYIATPYNEIKEIGLILNQKDNDNWSIELSLYFGASQTQARSFYQKGPVIGPQLFKDWHIFGNFHVSFVTSNLVWLPANAGAAAYIDYWKKHRDKIRQQPRSAVPVYLQQLVEDGILKIGKAEKDELDRRFYHTGMQTLNMVPELGMLFKIEKEEAESLDSKGELLGLLNQKLREGLSIIGKTGNEFLKT